MFGSKKAKVEVKPFRTLLSVDGSAYEVVCSEHGHTSHWATKAEADRARDHHKRANHS